MTATVTSLDAHRHGGAYDWFTGLLDALGSGHPPGRPGQRQCPGHADGAPSLSVSRGTDGRVLVRCHAGCETRAVLDAMSCAMKRLFAAHPLPPAEYAARYCQPIAFPPLELGGRSGADTGAFRFEAEHAYGDRWWLVRSRHPVTGAKSLTWETLNSRGERVLGLLGTPLSALPMYRQSDIRMGIVAGETVVVVESESSVDAMAGVYGTTWAGGAGNPPLDQIAAVLADHPDVVIIPDNDGPGLACAAQLQTVLPNARTVIPDEPGEDARDLYTRLGPTAFSARISPRQESH